MTTDPTLGVLVAGAYLALVLGCIVLRMVWLFAWVAWSVRATEETSDPGR